MMQIKGNKQHIVISALYQTQYVLDGENTT